MVRIALREVADAADLEETTAELSQIAEICIRRVFDYWNIQLRQELGSPQSELAILALGKLALGNPAVRRNEEAVFIDAGVDRQR